MPTRPLTLLASMLRCALPSCLGKDGCETLNRERATPAAPVRTVPCAMADVQIDFVYPRSTHAVDGIRSYAYHLLAALRRAGITTASMHEAVGPAGWIRLPRPKPQEEGSDRRRIVVVHYQPFSYARWGFAPLLPIALWHMRRRRACRQLVVVVHEVFVTPENRRQGLMRMWQRLQLAILLRLADTILVTKEWSGGRMRGMTTKPILHLPAGSTLPDGRSQRSDKRRELGLPEDEVVLAALGTGLITRNVSDVAICAAAVSSAGYQTTVFNLGAGTPRLRGLPSGVRLLEPGHLQADELAAWLAAADIYLAPLSDGASSGRTSIMAALQHGLPVIGTLGEATEAVLAENPEAIMLVPAGRPDLMAGAAAALAADGHRRREMGRAATAFYRATFDWDIIALRMLTMVGLDPSRGR